MNAKFLSPSSFTLFVLAEKEVEIINASCTALLKLLWLHIYLHVFQLKMVAVLFIISGILIHTTLVASGEHVALVGNICHFIRRT